MVPPSPTTKTSAPELTQTALQAPASPLLTVLQTLPTRCRMVRLSPTAVTAVPLTEVELKDEPPHTSQRLFVVPLIITLQVATAKASALVAVPPGVVTDTSLAPKVAELPIVMPAVTWVALFTVRLFTAMSEPKLTVVAPVK
jgi:hypothetical protein